MRVLAVVAALLAGPHFSTLPPRVLQGSAAAIAVRGGSGCLALVRYADGTHQALGASASNRWRWVVPGDAHTGPAAVSVACARGGSAARTVMVVGAVIPAKIGILKDGYSIRPKPFGGTDVSYGVLLQNSSPGEDALNVSALVNMVDASNHLIGTVTANIDMIPAGQQYALGGNLSFPGAAPVARLEVVLQVGGHQKSAAKLPALANVEVFESTYDQGWVGGVQGEMANGYSSLELQRANLSAVILDAAGNVLGGGTGFAFAALPPGAREFFKIDGGFSAIPVDRAASAVVSVSPTYSQAAN
jgi:hypothetical protein